MNSTRPYLFQAFYNWIVDNQCTPYTVVDATVENVSVPIQYVEDGKIVLNIAPSAIRDFNIDQAALSCRARFGGEALDVYVPARAIIAIYAKENGRGMVFSDDDDDDPGTSTSDAGKPKLRVVK